ncbi:MAG: YaiI/YqxD family protein [Gammaproteobacteria bacterium]|nr:YaiI/YqxD family protein [Gammaproteobacteria bacterium]
MQIWIDADACPKTIKDILYRMAIRTKIPLKVVSNHAFSVPASVFIKKIQVGSGFDVVDAYIVEHVQAGDLVITADIPFADAVVSKQCFALNPRGELYSENNIKQLLGKRDMNEVLRGGGMISGGLGKLSAKEVQKFANHLDKWVSQRQKSSSRPVDKPRDV